MEGGVSVGGMCIRLLAYADDIVLLAPDRLMLRKMIANLEMYCERWNLQVNLDKSKIMIFRRGGKTSKHDVWRYKNEPIEVVKSYKYLGMNLTSQLSLTEHFKEKSSSGKMALNMFNGLLAEKNIPFKSKFKVFEAVSRSVVCYGAQIWGGRMIEEVEKVQRFFLKKVFNLPVWTPNYCLYLETQAVPLLVHTLKLHIKFLQRSMKLPAHRYPRVLLEKIIEKKLFIYNDWLSLQDMYGVSASDLITCHVPSVLARVDDELQSGFRRRLQESRRCSLYPELAPFTDYVHELTDFTLIKWFMKARTELVQLNKYSHSQAVKLCSLCSLKEEEDIIHFVARCPVLAEIRRQHFGRSLLLDAELKTHLDGEELEDCGKLL
ncbi:uncharacterized protein LOC120353640 [Nilaparvata lugens]|uniref:uncharacterized protein LOC120353640 n=1 Tax=Nilaparvata lugens TaxID=108931 RepID=UPI00193E00D6|nr:uncharacterized protein LOC120353640 [Nilaparvata lugens]